MDQLGGIVERITYANEETGFCVVKLRSKGYSELVTAVGSFAFVNAGASVKLTGEWKTDSKYGRQFKVVDFTETVPATIAGIEKYLGSGLIKGIGPVNAKRIVKHFKENTINIIDNEPDRLNDVEGIGPKRIEMIKQAWQEQKEIKNVMLFLQSSGVSTAYAIKIYKTYGNESISKVKNNPYALADDIWGIGFKTADKIARNLGFDANSYERCRSGIIYILNELSDDGHCYATLEQIISKAEDILEVNPDLVTDTIDKMIEEERIICDMENSLYLPSFFYSETGTARRIKEIVQAKSMFLTSKPEEIIERVQKQSDIKYDKVQIDAIKAASCSKFMVLTGGPGTGKTTTTLAIIRVFMNLRAKVLLAAPTGRAAKRLSEATGMEAKTIHRLLESKPPSSYGRNEENPLECNVLIIDETSMVDIILMYNLLKAVPDNAVVILVGDSDQLPSVGAGNVLNDIIKSGLVKVINLKRIFRQARGSSIVMNAHRINRGEFPDIRRNKHSDFFFIEEEDPKKAAETIKELCTTRLPGYYKVNPIDDIQVLCPMQRGDTGAQNLNMVLQQALNPSNVFIKYGGALFHLNDKVMQIKNNYEKNVFNGDIGKITTINLEDRTLLIKFYGNEIQYDATELDEVVLAYATTIHKSQGSEYKIVVAPISTQHYIMLKRNLLYTCVTRAKNALVLVGTKKAIAIAVSNNRVEKRNTLLMQRLASFKD
jgi:exodeoxyribonuclease V alpha subunit